MLDLSGYRRLLIYGGSFDPPHVGHVQLPWAVAEVLRADAVVYVPAGRAPHKLDKRQTDAEHRLAMLRLALQDPPAGLGEQQAVARLVLEEEIERAADGRPSFTVETLESLRPRLRAGRRCGC